MSTDVTESLCSADFKDRNPMLDTESDTAVKYVFSSTDCEQLSQDLGFDSRRLCAAHNIVALSKVADSLSSASIRQFLVDFDGSDDSEQFIIQAVRENPNDLGGTLIDEIEQTVTFRSRNQDDGHWRRSVSCAI